MSRTSFLAKLIGLYCIFIALSMIIHKQAAVETVTAVLHDASMILLLGVMTVAIGLAIILTHNVWSGGTPAVIVTLAGWLTLVKGLLFLFLPAGAEAHFFLGQLHYNQLFYLYMAVTLVIGIYLTFAGFTSKAES